MELFKVDLVKNYDAKVIKRILQIIKENDNKIPLKLPVERVFYIFCPKFRKLLANIVPKCKSLFAFKCETEIFIMICIFLHFLLYSHSLMSLVSSDG